MQKQSDYKNDLIKKIREGNCVAFIGAGFNAPAVRTWDQVLKKLASATSSTVQKQLNSLLTPQKETTLLFGREAAAEIIQDHLSKGTFTKKLDEALQKDDPEGKERVKKRYETIKKIPFHSLITTNFDGYLGGKTLNNTAFRKLLRDPFNGWIDSLNWDGENPRELEDFTIKLHGDINNKATARPLVFSRTDYRQLLFETPNYQSLIRTILATKVVVFLGFSFSDPYLNLIRHEVLSMLKTDEEIPPPPIAYAIMNDLSIKQVEYLAEYEGIGAITYESDNAHYCFDEILEEIREKTSPDRVLSRVLDGKKILWFDPKSANNVPGRARLRELRKNSNKKEEDYLVNVTCMEEAKTKLETDKSIDLLITHWGHKIENGEKQSNAITLARHIRKKDIEVPIIVFAGEKHAPENRLEALKFGAFDYVYEWHDLFSKIEDLFKDPVKDH